MSKKSLVRPVFIGMMGSGKSSIGRRLAARLDMPLIDLDKYIEGKAGMSIPEIFAEHGEPGFRRIETEALNEVITEPAIIATGGGVVVSAENRSILKANPPVIWLKGSPEFLYKHVAGDTNRPLIAEGNVLEKLRDLSESRKSLYEECSDLILDRDEIGRTNCVKTIIRFLKKWQKD